MTHSYRQVCNVQDSAEHPLNRWGGGKDSGDFLDCIVLADFSAIFPDSESESDNVSLHAMTNSPGEEGSCVLPFRLLYCSSLSAQPLLFVPTGKFLRGANGKSLHLPPPPAGGIRFFNRHLYGCSTLTPACLLACVFERAPLHRKITYCFAASI